METIDDTDFEGGGFKDNLEDDSSDSEFEYQMQEIAMNPEQYTEKEPEQRTKIDTRMDAQPPPEIREGYDPRGHWKSANTGPKGVLNDFEEAKLHMATERMRGEMRNERLMSRMAEGDKKVFYQEALPIEEQLRLDKMAKKGKSGKDSDESDSDSDLTDDSDDEAFKKYKLEQIKFVQNSLPSFGVYERLNNLQFAKVIKNTHELCFVVAHLYENHVAYCARLHLCFESLAAQFPQVALTHLSHASTPPQRALLTTHTHPMNRAHSQLLFLRSVLSALKLQKQ